MNNTIFKHEDNVRIVNNFNGENNDYLIGKTGVVKSIDDRIVIITLDEDGEEIICHESELATQ